MKNKVECLIELISYSCEEAWIISCNVDKLPEIITLFSALKINKITEFVFVDTSNSNRQLCLMKSKTSRGSEYTISDGCKKIDVSDNWVETIFAMMIDVTLFGWSQLAHIDQDFIYREKVVSICFNVSP